MLLLCVPLIVRWRTEFDVCGTVGFATMGRAPVVPVLPVTCICTAPSGPVFKVPPVGMAETLYAEKKTRKHI